MSHEHWTFSIIIPVYNESANLRPLCEDIVQNLSDYQYEIIFVDDGSSDDSREILQKLEHKYPQCRAVFHKANYGQSASIVSGARAAKYPWLVTLDGDCQNDPADVPKLLNAIGSPKQLNTFAVGQRAKRDDTWVRRLSSRVANHIRRTLLNDDCLDTGCSLKCFPRTAFLQIPHFNHLHRYLPALFQRAGLSMHNIPVNHRPRTRGVSKYGIRNRLFVGIVDIMGMIWLLRRPCSPETLPRHDSTSS